MKDPLRNAKRWMRQAEYDLAQARRLQQDGIYSYAAFFAEQAAQKCLKAFLLRCGRRLVTIHSVGELAREASGYDSRFAGLVDDGRRLDRHYLTSRYPDALPEPAIPAEAYSEADAGEAVAISEKIFGAVQSAMRADLETA